MLCATGQNDHMELENSDFLREDLDKWQSDDNMFMEVKKKKVRSLTKSDSGIFIFHWCMWLSGSMFVIKNNNLFSNGKYICLKRERFFKAIFCIMKLLPLISNATDNTALLHKYCKSARHSAAQGI